MPDGINPPNHEKVRFNWWLASEYMKTVNIIK